MEDLYLFPNYRERWNEKNLYHKSYYTTGTPKISALQGSLNYNGCWRKAKTNTCNTCSAQRSSIRKFHPCYTNDRLLSSCRNLSTYIGISVRRSRRVCWSWGAQGDPGRIALTCLLHRKQTGLRSWRCLLNSHSFDAKPEFLIWLQIS